MGWLGSGVLLWSLAHLLKRVAPGWRARLGSAGRPLVAVSIVLSVILMILGYQQAEGPIWWGRQSALVGINNLLVLIGFYMITGSIIGARISRFIRHPQLTAIKLWAIAHLLVNGDLASLILFGGLLIWAVLTVMLINRQEKSPVQEQGPVAWLREAGALSTAIVIYGLVGYAHGWLGYPVHG
tara:strand:+ start:854 stop:1402 length:549 start_codon:yes stop_codon:yes gene_type:complete